MSIIKVEPNKPLTLSLKNPIGQEVKGQYGIQFKYSLEPNDLIYLPPIAHAEIQNLHAGPGEPFTLLKTIGHGNQAVWKVERIATPDGPPLEAETSRPVAPERIAQKSITNGNGSKSPVRVMPNSTATLSTRQSSAMVRQLIAAVDACKLAQDYAKSQDIDFEITSDIICRVAITGGIQSFKEGVY